MMLCKRVFLPSCMALVAQNRNACRLIEQGVGAIIGHGMVGGQFPTLIMAWEDHMDCASSGGNCTHKAVASSLVFGHHRPIISGSAFQS